MDGYDKNGLTPFRAWCFKNWPYLISDDITELELLYAILGKFKEVLEEWEQMKVDWGEFQTTINEAISQMKQEIAEFEAKRAELEKAAAQKLAAAQAQGEKLSL